MQSHRIRLRRGRSVMDTLVLAVLYIVVMATGLMNTGNPLLLVTLLATGLFLVLSTHYMIQRGYSTMCLEEAERFAQATLDALAAHVCVLDEHGTIIAVNRAWVKFAQANPPVPANYGEGSNYLAVCDAAQGADAPDARRFAAGLRAVLRGECDQFSLEYPCAGPDEARWFVAHVARFPVPGPLRLVVSHENITERKRIEEALRVNFEKYHVLFESFPQGVVITDQNGLIIETNRAAIEILAVPINDHSYHSIDDLRWQVVRLDGSPMLPHEFASVRALRDHCLISNAEMGIVRGDGQIAWISVTAAPIPLDGYGVAVTFSDIGERRQAELQLRKSQQLLGAAQQILHVGSYEFVLATRQIIWSDEVREIFKFDESEWPASNRAIMARIHPADHDCLLAQARDSLAGIAPQEIEYRILLPDGCQRTLLSKPRLEYDALGQPTCVVGALLDITDIRRAEQERDQLAAILEATPDIVMTFDPEGNVLYINPAGLQIFGMAGPADWQRRTIVEYYPRWAAGLVIDKGIPSAIVGGSWAGETAIYGQDGREIPTSQVIISHLDNYGRVLWISTIMRDLSEHKRAERALRESEERLRQVTETLPQIVWLAEWFGDSTISPASRQILYMSPMFECITGYPLQSLAECPSLWVSMIHPDDREPLIEQYGWIASGGFECEYRIIRADGAIRYIHDRVLPIRDEHGRIYRIAGLAQDITERKQAEIHLRQAAAVFENTLEGVIITDCATQIVAVNRAFSEITGYSEAEALGKSPNLLQSHRHDQYFYQQMWATIHHTGRWQGEIWNRRKSGEVYPQWLTISSVSDADGRVANYIAVFSDISRLKQWEQQLAQLAHYDSLTSLPNRLLLLSRLEHALSVALRHERQLAVLFLDLDRFKNVNDSLGHPSGDELLVAISRRLRERVRTSDTLARLGGDEFVILLETIYSSDEVALVAEHLIALLGEPFHLSNEHEVYIGCSIGISIAPDDATTATQLIRNADTAMYQAKLHGGNNYQFYTASMTSLVNERLELERKLRRAIEREEFVLHYQPQVDIGSGDIVGVEALIRWLQPDQGLIPPGQFIPIAEETGLIVPLGAWVLRTACAQVQSWRHMGLPALSLAINLSVRQFRQCDLAEMIGGILSETGLPATWLELEITESLIMEKPEHSIATLQRLKNQGIRLAVDDFGTGYSSLSYLQRLAVDRLKIDRSFIMDLPQKASDAAIAATIIAMAQHLALDVVAEGVESAEQLAWLQDHGCKYYQGYLYSRPEPASCIAARLGLSA